MLTYFFSEERNILTIVAVGQHSISMTIDNNRDIEEWRTLRQCIATGSIASLVFDNNSGMVSISTQLGNVEMRCCHIGANGCGELVVMMDSSEFLVMIDALIGDLSQ